MFDARPVCEACKPWYKHRPDMPAIFGQGRCDLATDLFTSDIIRLTAAAVCFLSNFRFMRMDAVGKN